MKTPTVAIVGVGGLGTPALLTLLATWPKDRDLTIKLIDGDYVERSNLNRQWIFRESDLGRSKTEAIISGVREFIEIKASTSLVAVAEKLTELSAEDLIGDATFVIDGVDVVETKYLINDFCLKRGIPFCYGGAIGGKGIALPVKPGLGSSRCVRCVFGELDTVSHLTSSCRSAGIIGPVASVIGSLQGELARVSIIDPDKFEAWVGKMLSLSFPDSPLHFADCSSLSKCASCSSSIPVLDLLDQRCPATFLYTKLTLERLSAGDHLIVKVSSKEIATSVAASCMEEGHMVAGAPEHQGDVWQLRLRRGRAK